MLRLLRALLKLLRPLGCSGELAEPRVISARVEAAVPINQVWSED